MRLNFEADLIGSFTVSQSGQRAHGHGGATASMLQPVSVTRRPAPTGLPASTLDANAKAATVHGKFAMDHAERAAQQTGRGISESRALHRPRTISGQALCKVPRTNSALKTTYSGTSYASINHDHLSMIPASCSACTR